MTLEIVVGFLLIAVILLAVSVILLGVSLLRLDKRLSDFVVDMFLKEFTEDADHEDIR